MRNRIIFLLVITAAAFFRCSACHAQELPEVPEFSKGDRVLFMAPHPDDEAIGLAGAIQRAIKACAEVRLLVYTNGDANQFAFIVYEKRLTVRKGEFIHMGEVRRKETVSAMGFLGLTPDEIIFLGYPDLGTMPILTKHWGDVRPYKSIFTRVSKVSYPEALSMGAPYVGESVLKDIKSVLLDFKPEKIFVSHPADTNKEHRSLYLFLKIALWDLQGQIGTPEVFPYIIHVVGWPKPRGYHGDLELLPPLRTLDVKWRRLSLTEHEVKTKHDCVAFYKSQIEYNPPYLYTYVRKNELFGDYSALRLKQASSGDPEWQYVEIEAKKKAKPKTEEDGSRVLISTLAFARYNDDLLVRITTRRKIDKDHGISLYLLGYSRNREFAAMPKIRIYMGLLKAIIKDKMQSIKIKGFKITYEKNAVILRVPLSSLGYPDRILTSANAAGFPFEATAWRVLELE